jgi:transposase
LDEEQSGIAAFSETSLWLMEDRFSPRQIRGRQMKPLVAQAKKRKLLKAEEAIRKLKEHAGAVLSPVPEWVGCLQTTLYHEVQLYRCLLKCIEQTAREAALLLAQTPAAMMTTMKGTGIMLAAGVGSELGAPEEQSSVRRLTSYAGIIPRVKQTRRGQSTSLHARGICKLILGSTVAHRSRRRFCSLRGDRSDGDVADRQRVSPVI